MTKAVLYALLCVFFVGCDRQRAVLKWEGTSDNEDGFRIYRITADDRKHIAEVGPDVEMYVDERSSRGACYQVTAFNEAGESEPSNIACLPN